MREQQERRLLDAVLPPLTGQSRAWYAWLGVLLVLLSVGTFAYVVQLRRGLAVTGMSDHVPWGLYISNFVFWSGVSMAGTFVSAMLRITGAEWRRPLTRIAELSTVSALIIAATMPLLDLGRPDRAWSLPIRGRVESPLVWDLLVIPTYLAASALFLYLFLIPDAAVLRDRLQGRAPRIRLAAYRVLALGWRDHPAQRRLLHRGAWIMTILIIPIGVATHSVVSWIFGMTTRPGWDSTIFAPYFVVGALYSGTAMLITLMFIFRRVYRLEEYFTEQHFRYLGYFLAASGILYLYFTFAEYLTLVYKLPGEERHLLESLFFGKYAALVWAGFVGGQVIPIVLAVLPWTRAIRVLFVASLLVNVGMWIKRYIIVLPSLTVPLVGSEWGVYSPTWVEVAIVVASFAGFALIFTVFAKLFPILPIWEVQEGWQAAASGETGLTADSFAPHIGREPRVAVGVSNVVTAEGAGND
ncbi:MAG: polysulfide reductase NrfD [Dehalococcoidia bacterium]